MELTLFVDHLCNLRCTYCYNGEKFTRPMSADTMRKAVDLAVGMPTRHLDISFFGGEPLLRLGLLRETMEYAEAAVAKLPAPRPSLRFIFNTNGTLIDDEVLDLMDRPRTCAVFVSLDGAKDVHDRFRVQPSGDGSFDQVLEGIERLRERRIPFQLVAVVSTATAPELGRSVEALLELGAQKVILAPNFRDEWTDETVAQLREGLRDVAARWIDWFRAGKTTPLEPLHGKILTHLKGGIPCPSRCLIGGHEFTVTPSGRIYPCAQMVGEDTSEELVIGTVETGMLEDRMLAMQELKDRVEETCAPCALRDRCQSHCACRHLALTGKLGEITASLCEIEAAYIETADLVAETLYGEKNQIFIDYYYNKPWVPARGGMLTQLRRSREE